MPAVGELSHRIRRKLQVEEFAVHAHAGDEKKRLAVGRPLHLVNLVRKVRKQQTSLPSRRGNDEQTVLVVIVELLVRLRHEDDL